MASVDLDVPNVEGETGNVVDCSTVAAAERLLTAVQSDGSSFALLIGWQNDVSKLAELKIAGVPPYQAASLPVLGSEAVPLVGVPFRYAAAKRLTGTDSVSATVGGEDASASPSGTLTDPGVSITPSALVVTRSVGFQNSVAAAIAADSLVFWAADNITASDTDYFEISVGWMRLGFFVAAATFTTKTIGGGGIGDVARGTPVSITHIAQTMPAVSAAAVAITPFGAPTPCAMLFVYPITAAP